jgi:hypothetical protein
VFATALTYVPEQEWAKLINQMCDSFSATYGNQDRAKSDFKEALSQTLQVAQTIGAKPQIVGASRKLVKELTKEVDAPEKAVAPGSSTEDIDTFLAGLDINEIPVIASPESPLRGEMRQNLAAYVGKWTRESPFYLQRSKVDSTVMLVGSSVGPANKTLGKINVNGAIGTAKGLHDLGPEFLVTEDDKIMSESSDHTDGRAYFIRAVRIVDSSIMRFWASEEVAHKKWHEYKKTLIKFRTSCPDGWIPA